MRDDDSRVVKGTLARNLTTYFLGSIRKLIFKKKFSNIVYQTNPNFMNEIKQNQNKF